MALRPEQATANSSAFDQFLLRHKLLPEETLERFKREAEEKQQPLASVLQAHGLIDDIQGKWEEVFRTSKWAKYPSEEMIRFVARTYGQSTERKAIRFLDMGCGIGTSSWYLAKEGYTPSGIDCSPSAVDFAKEWFALERLEGDFQVALMQDVPYETNTFDCVIDNGSSTSTPLAVIRSIIEEARRVLKPGGRYYGMFLGDETTIEGVQDANTEDPKFYQEITSGPIQRAATVRLLSRAEIEGLFRDAKELQVDYALRTVNNGAEKVQYWLVSAVL